MKGSRPAEALTNAADDSRGIRWSNLPRTWQTPCFNPLSWRPRSPASSKPPSVSPTWAESTRGSAVWWGEHTACPGRRKCHKFGREREKESRGYFLRIKYQLGEQFLLPAASEARNKTSHCPGKAAWLSPVRTRLGMGTMHVPWTQLLPWGTARSYRTNFG